MPRLVDLTMTIREDMMYNPDHPRAPVFWLNQRHDVTQYYYVDLWAKPDFPPLYDGLPAEARMPKKGHGWQSEQIIIGTHMGTHVDAALHFNPTSKIDAAAIPLEICYGDAIKLDLRPFYQHNHPITVDELAEAEKQAEDRVKEGDIVIIQTGHAERYAYGPNANAEKYFSLYPGLAPQTAKWFIDRKVKNVGSDTINIDCDVAIACHINFLLREWIGKTPIYIMENLVNLEQLPVSRFTFAGFPLPFKNGSGSPIRAVALIE
jgi:kynurenine formamidase